MFSLTLSKAFPTFPHRLWANIGSWIFSIAIFRTTPPEVAGIVGAIYNSALQVGSALGNAIIISIETNVEAQPSGGGVNGYKGRAAAFWFIFAVVVLETISVAVFYKPGQAEQQTKEPKTPDWETTSQCTGRNILVEATDTDTKKVETA